MEHDLEAGVIPWRTGKRKKADIKAEIYIVTGRHGFLKIPESFCKECHMFYRSVQKAAEEVDAEVDIQLKSYWTRFLRPLLKGGYHPPVLLVNGQLFSQGYEVPDEDELAEEFRRISGSG